MFDWVNANIIIESSLSALIIILNGIVLTLIAYSNSLHNLSNYLIASLAASDLCVGAIAMPLSLYIALKEAKISSGSNGCFFAFIIAVTFTQTSIFGIVAISWEQFVAIEFPFFYNRHRNGRLTAMIAISCIWLSAALVTIVPANLVKPARWDAMTNSTNHICRFTSVMHTEKFMFYCSFLIQFLCPLFLVAFAYIGLLLFVPKKLKYTLPGGTTSTQFNIRPMKKIELARSMAIIIAVFLICWLPLHIRNAFLVWNPTYKKINLGYFPYGQISIWMTHMNAVFNPLIYTYKNRAYRHAFCKFFRTICHCQNCSCTSKMASKINEISRPTLAKRMTFNWHFASLSSDDETKSTTFAKNSLSEIDYPAVEGHWTELDESSESQELEEIMETVLDNNREASIVSDNTSNYFFLRHSLNYLVQLVSFNQNIQSEPDTATNCLENPSRTTEMFCVVESSSMLHPDQAGPKKKISSISIPLFSLGGKIKSPKSLP